MPASPSKPAPKVVALPRTSTIWANINRVNGSASRAGEDEGEADAAIVSEVGAAIATAAAAGTGAAMTATGAEILSALSRIEQLNAKLSVAIAW